MSSHQDSPSLCISSPCFLGSLSYSPFQGLVTVVPGEPGDSEAGGGDDFPSSHPSYSGSLQGPILLFLKCENKRGSEDRLPYPCLAHLHPVSLWASWPHPAHLGRVVEPSSLWVCRGRRDQGAEKRKGAPEKGAREIRTYWKSVHGEKARGWNYRINK